MMPALAIVALRVAASAFRCGQFSDGGGDAVEGSDGVAVAELYSLDSTLLLSWGCGEAYNATQVTPMKYYVQRHT